MLLQADSNHDNFPNLHATLFGPVSKSPCNQQSAIVALLQRYRTVIGSSATSEIFRFFPVFVLLLKAKSGSEHDTQLTAAENSPLEIPKVFMIDSFAILFPFFRATRKNTAAKKKGSEKLTFWRSSSERLAKNVSLNVLSSMRTEVSN